MNGILTRVAGARVAGTVRACNTRGVGDLEGGGGRSVKKTESAKIKCAP